MPAYKSKFKKKSTRSKTSKSRTTKPKYKSKSRNNINRGNVRIGVQPTSVQRGYLPFGPKYLAKLPYVENSYIEANGSAGTTAIGYVYSSNNMYDPRYSLGGHQPLQYDMLAAHYERVWVWGCAIELTFSNPQYDGMWVGYRCRANTNSVATAGQTLEYIQETRDCAVRPLNNTGSQKTTFKFYISNPKLLGIDKKQYSNLEYSHITGGNPAVYNWIEPFAVHTVGGQDVAAVRYNIKLTYYGQFTNAITENQN